MDFNSFNTRAAADNGRDMHIQHPVTGEPLYNDKAKKEPCMVTVRGAEGREVQAEIAAVRERLREAQKEGDEKGLPELHDELCALAMPLITGFKNVYDGDKPAGVEFAATFLNLNMLNGVEGEVSFVEQVHRFASARGNYLGNG